ncbi:Protein neprosin [Cardamine amara subsp. amara]|uniref:Protein neprosin n=1 Tax=Cardamine amara subsp. amara TaxID=228776 RepID=A0ABD1BTQ7_CARAN
MNNDAVVATPVGYWPPKFFTRLTDYADRVQWGGEIVNKNISGRHTTTQMRSGYLPGAKATYMRDLKVAVNFNNSQPISDLVVGTTNSTYYRIKKISNTSFSFGGPEHAGAVHLRLDFIFLYIYLDLFLLF